MGLVGLTGWNSLNNIIPSFESMYVDRLDPAMDLTDVLGSWYEIRLAVVRHYLANDPAIYSSTESLIRTKDATVDSLIKTYAATYLVDEEKKLLSEYLDASTSYRTSRQATLAFSRSGRKKEAYANMTGEAMTKFAEISKLSMKLVKIQGMVGKELYVSSERQAESAKLMLGAVVLLSLVFGFGMAFFIARQTSRPLKELASQAELIAEGDLTVEIAHNAKDEVGLLAASFRKMTVSLRETIGQVGEASSAVASASSQISSSTEEMAAGSQEQTSQAGEVASAVEEMTKTIVENSKNASAAAETAKQAKLAAETGGSVVGETIDGMNRIASVVNQSAETVRSLGKSSQQIGEIIGVIDDIADQTNLLALNAAIEAARAGEQGRGFAVVADEVRKLAERTTKATKEIAGMIRQIQSETSGAVASMEEGTKQVDHGKKLAARAGESLRQIVEVSQCVTDMVSQIAAASEQQSSASEQISKNVVAISAVTGETASGTQQIASAAEDLNRLTENLQQLVGKFKISGGHADGKPVHSSFKGTSSARTKSRLAVRENGVIVQQD